MQASKNIYQNEQRTTIVIALIFAFRMLGLFMILPIFALGADDYHGASASLIGLALGIYGLTQAALQIPFGTLSDRFGRKPMIILGLALFAVGGIVAALSTSITGLILGRALQGAGAIGSTLLALIADLTRVENRSKAMATVGFSIGSSFMLAMALGPFIYGSFKLSGLFWFTSILAITGIGMILFAVPNAPSRPHIDSQPVLSKVTRTLKNTQLLRLDMSIFCLHAVMTALFLVLPIILNENVGIPEHRQGMLYLPVLIGAFLTMLPVMLWSDKRYKTKTVMLGAISALTACPLSLYIFHNDLVSVAMIMLVFFAAFSLLEATLPSLISKLAPVDSKGTALGIYSTSQFLGIFFGGSAGGIMLEQLGIPTVLLFCSALSAGWLIIAYTLPSPPQLASLLLPLENIDSDKAHELHLGLKAQPGVVDATVIIEEKIAYLKVDSKIVDKPQLIQFTKGFML